MAVRLTELRLARQRAGRTAFTKSLSEAHRRARPTAFLCHSHQDEDLAQGLQVLLYERGWDIYIDWQDTSLPETPDRETAATLKNKIEELDWFIFLATPNSTKSRWCPWEIGYADKAKRLDRIVIVPTEDQSGKWYGNEYLQLYNQLVLDAGPDVIIREAGKAFGGRRASSM